MKEETLIGFMVMEKRAGEPLNGLGFHHYVIPPRAGEYITVKDANEKIKTYKVLTIMHPINPIPPSAGDLFVEYAGDDLEVRLGI